MYSKTEVISLDWNTALVPENVALRMTDTGLDIDMKAISSTILPKGTYTLTITATATEIPTYTLTTSNSSGGTVTTPGVGSYPGQTCNANVAIVASNYSCYTFLNWSGTDAGSVANVNAASTTINMSSNKSIQANFTPATYTLTTSNSSGGTVTTPGVGSYPGQTCNANVAIVASNYSCYTFLNWSGTDAGSVANVNAASTTINMSSNKSIQANFAIAIDTFTLLMTADPTAGGSPSGTVTFDCGSNVAIHANTNSGYTFAGWTPTNGIDNASAEDTKVAMTQNRDLIAHYTLTTPRTASQTSLTSTHRTSNYGQSVRLTATVSAHRGTPTGTVTFMDGATVIASNVPLVRSRATFTTNSLTPGSHAITAVYNGDTNFSGSTSSTLNQMVRKASTSTRLTSSSNPSHYGNSVTFTATIRTTTPGLGTPTGTVTFRDWYRTLGVIALDGSGQATYPIASLSRGIHCISAVYNGDSNFSGSSRVLLQWVNR